jgi:hypothetical protein
MLRGIAMLRRASAPLRPSASAHSGDGKRSTVGSSCAGFHPAQPLRDLDMHRGRHRTGIVTGAALNVAWTTGSPVTS